MSTSLAAIVAIVVLGLLAAYLLIGVLMNAVSRSRPERFTMVPVSAVLCLASTVVALG